MSLQGSSTEGKPQPRGWEPAGRNNTTFICTEPLESCKKVTPRTGPGAADKGGLITRTNLARKGGRLGGHSPAPEKSPRGFLALLSRQGA